MPQTLKDATVAIEDKNFFEHGGDRLRRRSSAPLWKDLEAGKAVEGGSTITQQLVRNLYIQNPEETIERKIIEARLAEEEEDEHSKDWILDLLPQHRSVRHGRRGDRGRRRGGGADLLRQAAPRT